MRRITRTAAAVLLGLSYAGMSAPASAAGTTAAFHPYVVAYPGSTVAAVATGDVTGDGLQDMLVTTDYSGDDAVDFSLWVYAQQGGGGLDAPVQLRTGGAYGSAMAVSVADLDGDGDLDAGVATTEGVKIFAQQAGMLTPSWTVPTGDTRHAEAVDVSGDGLADLVALTRTGIRVWWQVDGDFMPAPTGELLTSEGAEEIEVADVTGDGLADVVAGVGDRVVVRAQTADHGFLPPVSHASGGLDGWDHVNGLGVGDLDGDGRTDVAVSVGGNKPNAWVAIRHQQPDGTLGPVQLRSSYDIPESLEVADVTGDGLDDVVVAHGGWNRVGVFPQPPPGTTALGEQLFEVPYASHYDPKGLAVGDISDDGLADVLLADYNHGLVILRGTVAGADVTPPQTTITGGPSGTHRSRTATFSFAADEAATFECAFDSTTQFQPCTSPATWTDLAAGSHQLRVRATDAAGNTDTTPATRSFTVDGPDTEITSGPSGAIRATSATFEFASPGGAAAGFECSMDGAGWEACASPKTYDGLVPGSSHAFGVRAVGVEGLVDSSPATRAFTVEAPADLTVDVTATPDPARRGDLLVWSTRVVNTGAGGADEVTLSQFLPEGVDYRSASVDTVAGTCAASGSPTVVRCQLGRLDPGAEAAVTVHAVVTARKGSLTTTAVASTTSWELDPDDDSASVTTTLAAGRGKP